MREILPRQKRDSLTIYKNKKEASVLLIIKKNRGFFECGLNN